jgi:UDP-4-amino-4,6-dideoxy-N-acetyl-beta-L-altrosamine transaminase
LKDLAINGGIPIRKTPLYYGHQWIDEDDINAVVNVLRSDHLTCGPEVEKLEEKLCEITGAKFAVALSNGTAALHAACYVAGVENGDEVITTPMTFAASANCALYRGAKPIFADIDPATYNISPESIKKKINKNTKVIVAVDFTGQAVELDEIYSICREHNILLIEDGAHSIGTTYKGKPVGSIADLTTFSFHPVKTVTGGEGGAVLTNNKAFYQKLMLFRSHGITRNSELMVNKKMGDWYYEQIELGYNYRITDIQASLITSQLDKLTRFKKRRQEIVAKYNRAFSDLPGIILQKEIEESDTTRHLYIIQLDLEQLIVGRKEIFDALKAENICCNVHYIPIYYFPYYRRMGYKKGICPNAEKLYERILTIPLYPAMTDEDVDCVIKAVKKVIGFYLK